MRLSPSDRLQVEITLDGERIRGPAGEPLASTLFSVGHLVLGRSIKYHRPRAAFCLQGSCGACLVRIDGRPNIRACVTPIADGMKVERQNAFPSASLDLLGVTDFFFPRGLDHHTLFTGAPLPMRAVMQKIARQMAGVGRLPDDKPLEVPSARSRRVSLVVVGGGPAGLSAAIAAANAGRKVLLIEEHDTLGGSLLADPRGGVARAQALEAEARRAGVEIILSATALAYYPEDRLEDAHGLLAISTPDGLLLVAASTYLYATGSYDQNALFPDNDRAGVMAARAIGRLLVRDRILPAKRIAVLGAGPYARSLGDALETAGAEVTRVDGIEEEIVAVTGHSRVRAIKVRSGKKTRRIACELVAVAALPAPATELLREHGCAVAWEASLGGFHAVTDDRGRTSVPNVYAVGDVAGFLGTEAAAQAGERIGRNA